MRKLSDVVGGGLFALLVVLAAPPAQADDEKVDFGGIVRAAPLPEGYAATVQEIRDDQTVPGEVVTGKVVVVSSQQNIADGILSGVAVLCEGTPRPTNGHKVAAVKGYVNATGHVWAPRGYQLAERDLPDPETFDFAQRYRGRLTFKQESLTLYVEHQIFFTDRGFNVSVMAQNPADLKLLSAWADTVEPAPPAAPAQK